MAHHQGFTLIELLIVIVVIGALAAVSVPRFGQMRERAYFTAMRTDLRNLFTQQQLYYEGADGTAVAPRYAYSSDIETLGIVKTEGVVLTISTDPAGRGWSAIAMHTGFSEDSERVCAIFVGTIEPVAPAVSPGMIACAGE